MNHAYLRLVAPLLLLGAILSVTTSAAREIAVSHLPPATQAHQGTSSDLSPQEGTPKEAWRAAFDQAQSLTIHCSSGENKPNIPTTPIGNDLVFKWLEFISKFLIALAWPIVTIVIAWRLGPELKKKIPLLKRLKAGPLEAEFNEEVAALRDEIEVQTSDEPKTEAISNEEARLLELAKVSPRSAIVEAWRTVEVSAMKAVADRDYASNRPSVAVAASRPMKPYALGRELGFLEILDARKLSLFHELRHLRNQAAHDADFETNFEAANNYIQLTESLRQAIQRQAR